MYRRQNWLGFPIFNAENVKIIIISQNKMPSQIILSMTKTYPFGQCLQPQKADRQVLVKKTLNTETDSDIISKAKHFKKLKIPHSIQIQSIFQNSQSIEIYYEYVPIKFQIWMKTMSDQLYNHLLKQLYSFCTFLSLNRIQTRLCLENLGFNQDYHIKYFLDLETTDIEDNFTPNLLKEKYYREISELVKTLNSANQKTLSRSLFLSVKENKQKSEQNQARISLKILNRTPSMGEFDQKIIKKSNVRQQTETTQNQQKLKKSALKAKKLIIYQKLQNLKHKLQSIKQSEPTLKKGQFSLMQFSRLKSNPTVSSGNKITSDLKKPYKSRKQTSTSIDRLIKNLKQSKLAIHDSRVHLSPQPIQNKNFLSLPPVDKMNKSQRYRTPKSSQSPIQYLDMFKSTQEYVQDFLNVLEDPSQCEEKSFEEKNNNIEHKETLESDQQEKQVMKTQCSEDHSPKGSPSWKSRYMIAIENSKKIIDRMKCKKPQIRVKF